MKNDRVALLLVNDNNEYQQLVYEDAKAAALRHGLTLEASFAQNDVVKQFGQLYEYVRRPPEARPRVALLFPVRDGSFELALRDAAAAGIACATLNRRPKYLAQLRAAFPGLPFGSVSPDQHEIGRIQGRQACSLAPAGSLALYIMGPSLSSATQDRAEGFREVVRAHGLRWSEIHGDWDAGVAEKAVRQWLRLALICEQGLALVACQNDAMGHGARRALEGMADELRKPELRRLPVTGVDGLPAAGQTLVAEGVLTATIVQRSSGGPAMDWAARWIGGERPTDDVVLPVTPHPDLAATLPRSA